MKKIAEYLVRVFLEDTDHGGVVYHANYLKFMERARSEWLYSLELGEYFKELKVNFVVRSASIDYFLPTRLGEQLKIETFVKEVKRTSVTFLQKIINLTNQELICSGEILIVIINEKFRPTAIPEELMNYLKKEPIYA